MRRKTGLVALFALAGMAALVAGCAGSGRAVPDWQPVARFGAAESLPRVVLYGDLGSFLPRFNPTPALDEFLYGPAPVRQTILRNPQGLTALGTALLVCDQGYAGVIGIGLDDGRSALWQERTPGLRCPVAVVRDDNGTVYVADTTLRAVLAFSPEGKFVEEIVPDPDPDRDFRPASLLLSGGTLFIGNVGEHRVDRWRTVERQWLPPIVPPADGSGFLAPTGLGMTAEGVLLIVDSLRSRVFRLASDGTWLRPIGRPGRLEGEWVRPKQACVTSSGLLFVTDAGRQSVMVFTVAGQYVTEVKEQPDRWQGFTLPAGVLALPADGLAALFADGRTRPDPMPDEWVIVTDTLNASSLNLLGVFLPAGAGEAANR